MQLRHPVSKVGKMFSYLQGDWFSLSQVQKENKIHGWRVLRGSLKSRGQMESATSPVSRTVSLTLPP